MLPAPAEGSPVAACSRQCTWAARHIQQQQPPTEKFASSKMQCPLGRAEGRGSGHKSMPRRACVPRGLECERLVCQSRDVSPYAYRQRNDPAPLSLRRGAPECVWLRKFETYRSDVRLVAARDTRAAIVNQFITGKLPDDSHSARRTGPRPGAALGGRGSRRARSRGTAPRAQPYDGPPVVARPPRSTIR
jgi:hypothetical protein